MKPFRILVSAALLLLTLGATGQTTSDVVVDVPFAFFANAERLPAGHYIVSQKTDMIRIFNYQSQGLYVPTHLALRTNAQGSKLVFHRYGETYFLSSIWTTGSNSGKELFPSSAEVS